MLEILVTISIMLGDIKKKMGLKTKEFRKGDPNFNYY